MAKLPKDFDWHQSQGYIYLLSRFTRPHDVNSVKGYPYGFQDLKEPFSAALDRLIRDGALEDCSLAEKLGILYKFTDLKAKLRDHGLKAGRTKDESIQQLIDVDSAMVAKEIATHIIIKCSDKGLSILECFEQNKDVALILAKKTVYDSLLKLEIIQAKKIYSEYLKIWEPSKLEYFSDHRFRNIRRILEKSPKRLTEKYDAQILRKLQAAVAMELFWRNEPVWDWFADDVRLQTDEIDLAMQLIDRYQKYLDTLDYWLFHITGISFGQDNPNVCDNCRKLEGSKLDKNKAIEWPFEGCTNPIGCLPLINYDVNYMEDEPEEDEETEELETKQEFLQRPAEVDFFSRLKQLKCMLDEELITTDEYQAKKADILSRM